MKKTNTLTPLFFKAIKRGTLALFIFNLGTTTSYANVESKIAGKTLLAKGSVNAVDPTTNTSRKLKRRSKILSVDQINTGEKSKAQFSMSDGGLITLKENTKININNYIFDKETQKGSATLEVISGGLRSISGLIKKTGGDYQVKTPVGSIGIRGTHFSVQIEGDQVYFGVYSGNIDIALNNNKTLSLGVTEGFAFASVNEQNEVTPYTQAPEVLSLGYSTSKPENKISPATSQSNNSEKQKTVSLSNQPNTQTALSKNEPESTNEKTPQITSESEALPFSSTISPVNNTNNVAATPPINNSTSPNVVDIDVTDSAFSQDIFNELVLEESNTSTIAELISQRTGTFNYQELTESSITSSTAITSDLSLNLAVDFDNGTVPGGSLSFSDEQGEWFAAYSGLINIDQLALGVNFASHGNQKAEGEISAAFANGLSEISGSFNLNEIENPEVNSTGSFKLK